MVQLFFEFLDLLHKLLDYFLNLIFFVELFIAVYYIFSVAFTFVDHLYFRLLVHAR